jgi:hypothetical protein
MSEDKNTTAADDLDVESSEAASVTGGRSSSQFAATQAIEEEMFRLESEGYVPDACNTEGTVMINSRGHRVTVKTAR